MLNKLCIYFNVFHLFSNVVSGSSGECRDLNGRTITQDMHYVPGPDSCTLCICDNGHPKWCKAVLCSPPQDCKSFRVGKSCCEFICLDDAIGKGDGIMDFGTDFGLRLVVSAVAAVLSLCLLFFLVHRLRQKKIRGRQNRQLSEDERSLASIGYITGSLGYLPQNYFSGHGGPERHLEFHYEEPPTHLSLWKPSGNYFPRGEAPPPYEEAVSQTRNEVTISASNTLPNMSHRTIPLNLTTTGTIRLLNPSSVHSTLRRDQPNITQNNPDLLNHSHSSTNIVQTLDHNTVCIVETTNTLRHSLVNRNNNLIRNDSNSLNRNDFNANTVIRNTVSLPRNTVKQKNSTNFVNLRQNLEKDTKSDTVTGAANAQSDGNLNPAREASTLRYEININSNTYPNEESFYNSLRKIPNGTYNKKDSEMYVNGNVIAKEVTSMELPSEGTLELKDIPPPLPILHDDNDSTAIRSDALYEDVMNFVPKPNADNCLVQSHDENHGDTKKEDDDEASNESDILPPPVLEETSLTEPDADNEPSSCDCSSYQCLTNDDNDDYRSECENCKSGHGSSYYLDEDPEPPETMTLQRVPKECDEFENQEQYYRTSLTLPTHCRKPRITQPSAGARENWFSSMPESGSSSEEE